MSCWALFQTPSLAPLRTKRAWVGPDLPGKFLSVPRVTRAWRCAMDGVAAPGDRLDGTGRPASDFSRATATKEPN